MSFERYWADVKTFASDHVLLSFMTAGTAPLIGVLLGRVVTWIKQAFGTSEKANQVAQAQFSKQHVPEPDAPLPLVSEYQQAPTPVPRHCIPVSDNGNCLYESISKGLKHLKNIDMDAAKIRQIVADTEYELRDNEEMFIAMLGSFETEKEAKLNSLTQQYASLASFDNSPDIQAELQRIQDEITSLEAQEFNVDKYIQNTRADRTFGGSAELYALSQILPVTLILYELKNGSVVPRPDGKYGDGPITLKLLLDKNHFQPYVPPDS